MNGELDLRRARHGNKQSEAGGSEAHGHEDGSRTKGLRTQDSGLSSGVGLSPESSVLSPLNSLDELRADSEIRRRLDQELHVRLLSAVANDRALDRGVGRVGACGELSIR